MNANPNADSEPKGFEDAAISELLELCGNEQRAPFGVCSGRSNNMPTVDEFLSGSVERNRSLINRLNELVSRSASDELDHNPDPKTWSPAQVLQHMLITNGHYFPAMRASMAGAPKASGDAEVRYSLIGKLIRRMAGPGGNAPAPKMLFPGEVKYSAEMLKKWLGQQEELIALLEQAKGLDISRMPVRNPFFSLIRMNLADSFEIMTAHTERHVGQIEERVRLAEPTEST